MASPDAMALGPSAVIATTRRTSQASAGKSACAQASLPSASSPAAISTKPPKIERAADPEPWRAKAFPIIKDLITNRSAFDRIIQAGGFVSVNTGGTPDGNALPVPKTAADLAMDAAACIGCGACVAVCKNASAMLFVAAKVSHINLLPQGKAEKDQRVLQMVRQMDNEGFGNCTVTGSCEAVCPKEISLSFIAKMNRDYGAATLKGK